MHVPGVQEAHTPQYAQQQPAHSLAVKHHRPVVQHIPQAVPPFAQSRVRTR